MMLNPSLNDESLFSFSYSIFFFNSICIFLTVSYYSCLPLKSENFVRNSEIICRLFPLIFFKFYSSVTSIVLIFCVNSKNGSNSSSERVTWGRVSSTLSIGNTFAPEPLVISIEIDWLSKTELSTDLFNSAFFFTISTLIFSMFYSSSRKS